jgi:carbonic anhydrase
MRDVVSGFVSFKKKIFPKHRRLLVELANGQRPDVMFITCSDSRIDPNLVTQSRPGDLFIVRNAGNIVPPHTYAAGGITATIEYGVVALGVRHIVVCGHTHCGALSAALNPAAFEGLTHVQSWLELCHGAIEAVKHQCGAVGPEQLRLVTEQNVLLQLEHLRTHSLVASRLQAGKLHLHGWLYEIEKGDVYCYDEAIRGFRPFVEHYEALLANNRDQTKTANVTETMKPERPAP